MKNSPWIFAALLAVGVVWRVAAALDWTLVNFAPFTALAFCGAAGLRDARGLAVAVLTVAGSDLWINAHYAEQYGYTWTAAGALLRLAALGAATGLGALVSRRPWAIAFWSGSVASTLLFFAVTNTAAWVADPFYAKTAAGWWQALTIGHPEFPPTFLFLARSLVGDLAFTGLCALWSLADARRAAPLPVHAAP